MNISFLVLIPVISALIGWITNFIAVKMIFRPHTRISVFGVTFQGLIPKRKSDLARKIGETIEHELISHQDIHQVVNTPQFHEEILDSIMNTIESFLSRKLGANPLMAMLLSGDTAAQIKNSVRQELRTILPAFMESMFEKIEDRLDFKEIIREKIELFDLLRFERIVYAISSRELRAIEIFGGILGFAVGIIQVIIIVVGSRI